MYDSYKRKVGATQPPNYAEKCEIVDAIVDDFYTHPGYTEVYKNNTPSITYDAIIADGDLTDKTVGYKRFLSYPYSTIQFTIGDYIHFDYGATPTVWLLTSLEKQFTFEVAGRIYQCNNTLQWNQSATPYSYPCYIEDRLNETEFDFEKHVLTATGDIIVHVQKNAYTDLITTDYRFMFGGKAWKVRGVRNFINQGIITMNMRIDYVADSDTSTIADNDNTPVW